MKALFLLGFTPIAFVAQAQAQAEEGGYSTWEALVQLGLGALVAGPVFWWAMNERKERITAQDEIRTLHDSALQRERELGEKQSMVLFEAVHTLDSVKKSMDATLTSVSRPNAASEFDLALRRVEHLYDEMRSDRPK